jgi:xylulokinase
MSAYFVGVDLGTSGVKAGVVSEDLVVRASSYWDTELSSEGPGRMEQSPEVYYRQTLRIIAEVVNRAGISPGEVEGIALDGQMGGVIGIDKNFESITGLDMGLDIRSETYNELFHLRHGELLVETTCGSPRNTPKIIWWKREQNHIYNKVRKFVTLSCFVAGRMAGLGAENAFIDHTLISFFGNEDAKHRIWSEELTGLLDLDMDKFPRIVSPWTKIGGLTAEAARMSGLVDGVPVFAGAGDQPAGLLGGGFMQPGSLLDVSGSSTLLIQCVDDFKPDRAHAAVVYMPAVVDGIYHALTYINGGGMSLSWFCDEFLPGQPEDAVHAAQDKSGYASLTEKATALPPGSNGLLFLPYFGGRQCPYASEFRGGWLGLNWGHRAEHLFRSMLEALAYDYLLGLEFMRELFPSYAYDAIDATGGGSKNALWNSIKADILGLPLVQLEGYDFAIRGCAMLAGYGLGIYDDLKADKIPGRKESARFLPDPDRHRLYNRYYELFKSLYTKPVQDIMFSLGTIEKNEKTDTEDRHD